MQKAKFFLDTEFIESGPNKPIQLISIGIVAEDGRSMYAISSEFNGDDASQWVKENVICNLENWKHRFTLQQIADQVLGFVRHGLPIGAPIPEIEFWGYYADYDWVVFCQIFGTMMDLPKGFPMYCRDIKQVCDERGNSELPKQETKEHNALNDAIWNKKAFELLAG